MRTESRPLYYLKEGVFRKWLNDLYVALVNSTDNCKIISKYVPDDYVFSKIRGNELTKECMRNACLWLQWIRPFIKDEGTYQSQFLKPAQLTAEYLLRIRQQEPTTSVTGWVFSKSEPYEDIRFGIERITVSMIVPSLETIMSLRIRTEESKKISYGAYEFGEVQPIPLVNRLHQSHPKISKKEEKMSLRDYDFLKVSFDDFEKFSDSIEMSNFCEVDSAQSELRHHLGSAFVIPCKIIKTRQPRITIQSITSNSTKTILMSDQLLKNYDYEFLESLKNKTARLLAIQWYDPLNEKGVSKNTEVMSIEIEEDFTSLKRDELIGFVRMRNEITIEEFHSRFGNVDISLVPSLEFEQELIRFKIFEKSGDTITDEFLQSIQSLRNLRKQSRKKKCIQLNYFDVVDQEKISTLGLANLVKKDGTMLTILESSLRAIDKRGIGVLGTTIASNTNTSEEKIRRKSRWLANMGLVDFIEDHIMITPKGKKVISASMKNKIKEEISSYDKSIISIPEFETEIPPSLLYEFLKKNEFGYSSVVLDGGSNKLFWSKSSLNEMKKNLQAKFDFMKSELLTVMRNVNYPFTVEKAVIELSKIGSNIDFFSADILIRDLARQKILIPSGDSWEFPLKNRIECLLDENPNSVYSTVEIISVLAIPLLDKEKTMTILKELLSMGKISQISADSWSLKGNEIKKSEKKIHEVLSQKICVLLKSKQRGLDEKILVGMMERIAYDLFKNNKSVNRKKIIAESLRNLKENNIISLKEGIYKIKSD